MLKRLIAFATRSSKHARWFAHAFALSAIFHIPYVSGEIVGRWSFDGTAGEKVAIGTSFLNRIDESKFPAKVVDRHGAASTSHLSSISTFDDKPFDAYRESKFGVDIPQSTSLHFDGKPGNSQGCPLYIDDSDGELELQSFTFEFFVRRPKPVSSDNQYQMFVSKKYHDFGQGTYYNGLYRNANSVWFYHWCCVTNASGDVGYGDIELGRHGIEDEQWHHIALTIDGESHNVGFFIDHREIKTAKLPGPLAYGYSNGGTAERYPWVVGNHEQYNGYSWDGDIAELRISNVALQTDEMMWQGSTVTDGGTVMWLPLDGDFNARDWSGMQTTNGTFEVGVTNALAKGKLAFSGDMLNLRIVDGGKVAPRKENNGCLELNGGCVDLDIAPFKIGIYDAMTIEFFFKANFAAKSWTPLVACRQDAVTTGNYPNRLPFLFQENGDLGLNCRTDTPKSKDKNVSIPRASSPFDGKWHHVALIISHESEHAKQKITVYFDYEKVGDNDKIDGVFTVSDYHFLRFGNDTAQSVMKLDEFRISRGALPVSAFMRQTEPLGTSIVIR